MSDYENENENQHLFDPEAEHEEKLKQVQKRSNKISLFLILILIGGFFVFNLISKQAVGQAGYTFSTEGMTITDREGNETFVAFADVTEMVYVEDADYGDAVNGSVIGILNNQWMQGEFRSDYFGKYIASCDPRITSAIWLKTEGTSYVINKESVQTTQAIYEALQEFIH